MSDAAANFLHVDAQFAHDMGLPDSQSSEEFPISPQVPEDNSVFSRTTLHAALGGGDVATS